MHAHTSYLLNTASHIAHDSKKAIFDFDLSFICVVGDLHNCFLIIFFYIKSL